MEKITPNSELTKSKDLVAENIEKLKELFPEINTEGHIDFQVLKQILGEDIEEEEEYYRFTWAGKSMARMEAQKPSTGTLRPAKDESVDWESTKNLYVEGDNLEVLKLLQKNYARRVKLIYIDPPYNTGNDFVYQDNYKDNLKNYQAITGQVDSQGNKLSTNSESDGRFHSNWLNMMYPRLRLARNLLKSDGLICISIDDTELSNLLKMCNEIYGESNLRGIVSRATGTTTGQDAKDIGSSLDYLLVYSKSPEFELQGLPLSAEDMKRFKDEDEKGRYSVLQLRKTGNADRREDRPAMYYPVISPNGKEVYPIGPSGYDSRWRVGKTTYEELLSQGLVVWKKNRDGVDSPYVKYYMEDRKKQVSNLWSDIEGNKKASRDVKDLFDGKKVFDYPKPVELLNRIFQISLNSKNEIILDFFAGSSSTAHALMKYNLLENASHQFINIQLPEKIDKSAEANKLGFSNICELGRDRIRRAGIRLRKEHPEKSGSVDLGFKTFKLDSSNIKPWDGSPEDLENNLFNAEDNIKEGRSAEDVLYEVLLKYGLDLTLPIEEREIEGQKVFNVGHGALFVCLDEKIKAAVAEGIGKWKEEVDPEICRVIFRDAGFTDVAKTNATQTLKRFGITEVRSV